jgi:alpha-ketoglutarate-dependent taurine dioxygenase
MQSPQIIVSGKSCGAEVTGVDLTEPGSFAISALQQAMKEHLVVVVRGKALSSSQLLALGEFLGPLEPQGISVLATQNAELRRAHLVVSNQMPLERPTGSLGAGADIWQSDLSYRTRPCSIAILHAHEVPSGSRPDTRRKALYLGRRRNAWIIGMPLEESELLLDQLWAHATQPTLAWTHDWQAGDTLIWDNRCLLYRHNAVDSGTQRLMYRVQVRGEIPR